MWHQLQLLAVASAVLGVCLFVMPEVTHASEATTNAVPRLFPQPPGPQNATTPQSFDSKDGDLLSGSNKDLNSQRDRHFGVIEDQYFDSALLGEDEHKYESLDQIAESGPLRNFTTTTTHPQTNGHGYIQFDINDEQPEETASKDLDEQSNSKKNTVQDVLSSLFPDGFSNIFRFMGSEPDTKTSSEIPRAIETTTNTPLIDRFVSKTSSTTNAPSKNGTYYSYQTTVTREYRREVRPGHTQIVVEKISSADKKPVSSNQISQNDLLLINRAAVTSPVLPSMLLHPENEDNETLVAAESAPIVILGQHESDIDEVEDIEDNQIAETQNMEETHVYHHQEPNIQTHSSIHPMESYSHQHQQGPAENQKFNVHIDHNISPAKKEEIPKSHSQQVLHQYQDQEAPSRQFLKTFKPVVSGSADGPIPKGVFHYESSNLPQQANWKQAKEVNYYKEYEDRHHDQSNSKGIHSKLNTKAIASASKDDAAPGPSNYGGPTPSSLLYITLTPSKDSHTNHAAEKPSFPKPHDYVSEAAAEPSQHHVQKVISPKANNAETQLLVKPNGYTFVEVQKSVNIHNKLITEKDGQLVEMHETIYNPLPYQQKPFTSNYSPKEYVSGASEVKPEPAKNYDSLATHPINVEQLEYESLPQESTNHDADSASSISQNAIPYSPPVELVEKIVDQPVKEIVEKHIPVPYAVPQPIAVPVHFEHYVDRPYPVETIVEQPIPYPVETIVEKIVEKKVPVEVERIVEKPIEKIVEKYVDRPMAVPIHVPVAIHMPMPPSHLPISNLGPHQNALHPWAHAQVSHIPPKVLQNYYTRMLKKLLPYFNSPQNAAVNQAPKSAVNSITKATPLKPPINPVHGDAPKVATFSLADMRFDLRPPPPPSGSTWLQGARYIYNTLPADLSTAAASAPVNMVKSYIGPVPTTSTNHENNGNDFDEFKRWRSGHTLKRSPDFSRNLHMEYGFKPPLVPSVEIDDKGMPLKQPDAEVQ
ncbi:uncharacterized protein LOC117571856 isoform X1 [Drosophila albomicans]|uniref:Uncharacterized protein LOC117571856 isoform X1 n=1 Tax=Drosophila albomicans TaxID=7291 RepID=A0A6P8YYQ2_DROAB|nr:uncharacterized protein LOC117571856 isoform X1 [Drosophila albomicans]